MDVRAGRRSPLGADPLYAGVPACGDRPRVAGRAGSAGPDQFPALAVNAAAGVIPRMRFDNVREHALDWIWQSSEAFQKFRGEDWMPEPCRSCDRRKEDFGGCRCQAFLLTGDASATDPVCELAPLHHLVEEAVHEDAVTGSAPEVHEAPFHVQQEKMAGFWSYRTDPK